MAMESLKPGHYYELKGIVERARLFDSARIIEPGDKDRIHVPWKCRLKRHQVVNGKTCDFGESVAEERGFVIDRAGVDYAPHSSNVWFEGRDLCSTPWAKVRGTYNFINGFALVVVLLAASCPKCQRYRYVEPDELWCPKCGIQLLT